MPNSAPWPRTSPAGCARRRPHSTRRPVVNGPGIGSRRRYSAARRRCGRHVRTPTLTELRNWDTGGLITAAGAWASAATSWESVFTLLVNQVGTPWEGSAADRARDRAYSDRAEAIIRAERLQAAADAARTGADRIEAARMAVLQAADAAAARGFTVGEDFTVSADESTLRAQTRSLTDSLGSRLSLLMRLDRQVADEVAFAAAGLGRTLPPREGTSQSPAPDPGTAVAEFPDDPRQFGEIWGGLTQREKDAAFNADDSVGNRGGMPFAERDLYNRRRLDQLRADAQAETDRMQNRFDDLATRLYMGDHGADTTAEMHDLAAGLADARQRLTGYQSILDALHHSDGVPRLLSFVDDAGHAAVSIGDPDAAIRTAVFVPGTGQDLTTLDDNGRRALDMFNATLAADPGLAKSDVSVTTWVGYDRPMTLTEAAWPDRARNGAAALDRYLDGMHASHFGPPAVDTVIGHSYGSTVVGAAATGGHHLGADNVIAVGSPGMLSRHAGDLALDTGARVYAMTAGNDPISLVTNLTLGTDPHDAAYGAIRVATDPGPSLPYSAGLLPGMPAHSGYWDEGNPGLTNMGAIIAGLTPATIR